MMRIKIKSKLWIELFLLVTLVLVVTVGLLQWFFLRHEVSALRSGLITKAKCLARHLANSCEYGVLTENEEIVAQMIQGALEEPDLRWIAVQSADGKLLGFSSLEKDAVLPPMETKRLKAIEVISYFGESGGKDKVKEYYEVIAPVKTKLVKWRKEEIGSMRFGGARRKTIGAVRIGISLENMNKMIERAQSTAGMIACLVIVFALGATLILVRTVIKPVKRLMKATERIGMGDFSIRIPVESSNEIGELAKAFNLMTRRLKQTQDYLIRAEKLASIGEVAAAMAHELRNSFGVMKNTVYYLKMKLQGMDTRVERNFAILEERIEDANRIVTDLLEFSRPVDVLFENVDINRLIETSLKRVTIPPNIKLSLDINGDLPATVGDGEKLILTFSNLILNSIQAMPQGGQLRISARGDSRFIEVEFTDTGVGIPRENLKRIFEPLFTTKAKGIGLGLPLSKKYIDAHGGKIEVESKEGCGAKFTVKLPLRRAKN